MTKTSSVKLLSRRFYVHLFSAGGVLACGGALVPLTHVWGGVLQDLADICACLFIIMGGIYFFVLLLAWYGYRRHSPRVVEFDSNDGMLRVRLSNDFVWAFNARDIDVTIGFRTEDSFGDYGDDIPCAIVSVPARKQVDCLVPFMMMGSYRFAVGETIDEAKEWIAVLSEGRTEDRNSK